MTPVIVELPLRIVSVANVREHWAAKAARVHQDRQIVRMALRARVQRAGYDVDREPVLVTFTRVGPKHLDDDNLASACKAVRDGVADALDVDDGDPRVTFAYQQERGEYALRVEIARRTGDVLHMRPADADGTCEAHAWPTKGIAKRLIVAMRLRHGRGGFNVCRECLQRAVTEEGIGR